MSRRYGVGFAFKLMLLHAMLLVAIDIGPASQALGEGDES